ncbi:GNAT family N-acetyltransferase [Natronospira bacteriovora]|uniref:N-acetyltransferase family protein n=1 Tax=Natronospira bacteriovora TaxID=3069753 RepID=A0ABU0W5V9_9GAMM|nr:GNAT family N-acetyltransferase [Natronospira sp. AB-CW4]MDQ2069347.1 N-acetyltransferase family protein [Natronospira sp. AB-CW4]
MSHPLRKAQAADWPQMRDIFLQGIATGQASFETDASVPRDWPDWLDGKHADSVHVIEADNGDILAWGALAPTSRRACYRGVAEVQLYVRDRARGHGLGHQVLDHLIRHGEHQAMWTLQAIVFPENLGSRRLFAAHGFREVGLREKIARMNGSWRDTLLLERRSPSIE